jgi:hypothetical protein
MDEPVGRNVIMHRLRLDAERVTAAQARPRITIKIKHSNRESVIGHG